MTETATDQLVIKDDWIEEDQYPTRVGYGCGDSAEEAERDLLSKYEKPQDPCGGIRFMPQVFCTGRDEVPYEAFYVLAWGSQQ